ncbi:hypothetical protein [Marinobacter sp. W-8]|uniref:hypothetical protein n=1 Tax=Marinobacter sp. W-8 TaxID=3369658 RepID=UPI0037CA9924
MTNYIDTIKALHRNRSTKSLIRQIIRLHKKQSTEEQREEIETLLFVVEDENTILEKHYSQLLDDVIDDSINQLSEPELLEFFTRYPDPRYLIKLNPEKLTESFKEKWLEIQTNNYDYMISVITAVQQRIDVLNRSLNQHHKNSNAYKEEKTYVDYCKQRVSNTRSLLISLR